MTETSAPAPARHFSDDEIRRLWSEAGGDFEAVDDDPRWVARAAMDEDKLLLFLREFAALHVAEAHAEWSRYGEAIRAEEWERCARLVETHTEIFMPRIGLVPNEGVRNGSAYAAAIRALADQDRADE